MDKSLTGKIAMVTGAGRGIGAATARALAARGATVLLVARSAPALEAVAAEIRAGGGQASAHPTDITDAAAISALFASVQAEHGRMDILVNNAGIAPFGSVTELPAEKLRACLELNVVAVFSCMQAAIRLMKASGAGGKIINVGSVRSHWTENGDAGAYNASKFALRGMTESVARELHGQGLDIAVGMVCPGVVDTTLTNPAGEPRPHWLRPETVADAILHAISAPAQVNVFDTTLFPTHQKPW